jgi:DNA-binding transcriptional regulator LsrR (DeoR family)
MNLRRDKEPLTKGDIVKICYLYYKEGKTQEEISSMFGLSRFKIIRLLKEARNTGLVTIHINDSLEKITETEITLARVFGLKECVVVRVKEFAHRSPLEQIGEAGAQYLSRIIHRHRVLGVSWGRTLYHVVENVKPMETKNLTVVQISGGLGTIEGTDTNILTMMLSQRLGGTAYVIQAPVIVQNGMIRDTLLKEGKISEALTVARTADLVIVGIGIVSKEGGLWKAGFLDHRDYVNLKKAGAIGAIGGRFYDFNGKTCSNSLDDRIIGLTLNELRGTRHKIGVAMGGEKIQAIFGALRGQLLDALITDEDTAKALLTGL